MDRVAPSRARPVGFWPRAVAMAIDFIVIAILALPLALLLSLIGQAHIDEAMLWVIAMLYFPLAHARWGRTLGKAMFEIAVVPSMGAGPVSYAKAALRCAVKWSPIMIATVVDPLIQLTGLSKLAQNITATAIFFTVVLFLLYEIVVALRHSPSKLMPWDRIAGTQVVYRQADRSKKNPSKTTGKGQGKNRPSNMSQKENMA